MIFTLLLFILILGTIILVHETGHFIFAKLTDVYVYEFSLGMGPKIFSKKGKETEYCIRAIPIGGFVQLAGEEVDDDKKIPKSRKLYAKKAWQRFLVMFFGAGFNFIFAILLLFLIGLFAGATNLDPIVSHVTKGSAAAQAGLQKGDKILKVNGKDVTTIDDVSLYFAIGEEGAPVKVTVDRGYGETKKLSIKPKKVIDKGKEKYRFGIDMDSSKQYGFIPAIKYTYNKTKALFKQMAITVGYLFTGGIKVNKLSGPVGIYSIVGEQSKTGLANILYLVAFLSINVGFINLLPLPAFDGGHILFIVIEKIKGSPVDTRTENMIHTVGLFLLMLLMVYITFNDVLKLFQ